jgi:peptide deformylase
MNSIVTDIKLLNKECEDVASFEEAMSIIDKLNATIGPAGGVGLAANQIGINKKAFVIRVPEYDVDAYGKIHYMYVCMHFANPKILKFEDPIYFSGEGCLSFPGEQYETIRYNKITIADMLAPEGRVLTGLRAVVAQHECLPRNALIKTQDGDKTIKEIVDSRYSGKVLSFNENKKIFEYSNVIGWSSKKNVMRKKWVVLNTSKNGIGKSLTCTADHECAIISNIFNPVDIEYIKAEDASQKYLVRWPYTNNIASENNLYNSEQISIIAGGLLGDFSISKRGELTATHGKDQSEYAAFKANLLGGRTKPAFNGYLKSWTNTRCVMPATEQTKLLRSLIYNNDKTIKNIIPLINDIALAFWYMDDGCLIKRRNKTGITYLAQFHTEGFSFDDVNQLSHMLQDKFGIHNYVSIRKLKSGNKYIIRLTKSGSSALFSKIHAYIHKSLRHKIPNVYDIDTHKYNTAKLPYSAKFVKSVTDCRYLQSNLFDITVANNHNYVANNTLVHNCDHCYGITMHKRKKNAQGMSDPCPCNSGKKYKKCCLPHIKKATF